MDQQQNIPNLNLPQIEGIGSMSNDSYVEPNKVTIANQPISSGIPGSVGDQQTNVNNPTGSGGALSQVVSAPAIADDVDLIEKEWVKKISQIILKTKGNPFERARQLTILKQEYLQKRYNKTIKIT